MATLDTTLALVRDGRISFDQMVAETRQQFRAMAGYLARRWTPPACTTLDDIVQDLYLGAWLSIWNWQEGRGPTLARYVVYNAISTAKRALHKARGAKLSGSPDKNPSRIETPLSTFPKGDELAAMLLVEDAEQEERLIARETREEAMKRAIEACETSCERVAMLTIIEGGSVEDAAKLLYDNTDAKIGLMLHSEEHTARWIYREASAVVDRLTEPVSYGGVLAKAMSMSEEREGQHG